MQNYNTNTMLAGLKDLMDNPTSRVPVVLCLDTSGSMSGQPIVELNQGVQQYLQEMQKDDMTRFSVETAVVTFDNNAKRVADFRTVDQTQVPQLQAYGMTNMGDGLTMSLDMLEERKEQYKHLGIDYYQPILVVMSDGQPTGDRSVLSAAEQRIHNLCQNRKLTVVAVGMGDHADMHAMKHISPKQNPVKLHSLQFREFFAWLSRSVASVSASVPGEEPDLDLDALEALAAEPWPEDLL